MDIQKLRDEQFKLSSKVITKDRFKEIKLIAGCDQAQIGDTIISAIIVLDYPALNIKEAKFSKLDSTIPYIPGYLSYRESPSIVDAFHRLERMPDLMMVDGNGILHPRRIGMASHLGLLLDMPTIGVAKKLLCGEVKDNTIWYRGELRGQQIITKTHAKPIFVSPGHKISLATAADITSKCLLEGHKLPEPIHQAHKYANKLKKKFLDEGSPGQ